MANPNPPVDLLMHAAFVRRLAHHLLHGDSWAEDAAQETLIRALEHPPAGPEVRSWLSAVLRNVVRGKRRGEARRWRREVASARDESCAATDAAAARREILQRVVQAVLSLESVSQEIVLLRHYEDLPPRKIALRLGIPIEAVKSRLRRAYDRLRARLDEGASGNVEGWRTALALQPLVGWDIAAHLSKPGPTIGNGALHGGIIAVTTGTKIGLGAALLLVIVGGTLLLSRHEGPKRERSGTEEINAPGATHPALSGLAPRGGSPSHRAADPLPAPQSPPPQAGEGPTERELLDMARSVGPRRIEGIALLGREPATQGTARVWRRTLTDRLFYDRSTEGAVVVPIGRDGTFAFSDVDPGEYTFIVEVTGYPPRLVGQTVTDQASRRRVLVLGSGRIEGHVFDQDGRPLGDIVVQVSQGGDGTYLGRGSTAEVRSKADGTYSVDGLVSGPYWVISYVRQDRTALDASIGLKCDVLAEKTAVLDFGTPTPSPTWSGTVLRADGTPVLGPGTFAINSVERTAYSRFLAYDARGKFGHRIPPGTYRITEVRPAGHPPIKSTDPSELVVGREDVSQDVRFPGSRITGVIYDGNSALLSGRSTQFVGWRPENEGPYSQLGTFAEPDGSFVIEGLLPGRYVLSGHPRDLVDSSGRPMTVQVSEKSDLEIKLWTAPP